MYAQFATLLWEWRDSGRWTLLQFFGIMLGLPMFLYVTLCWTQWRVTGRFGDPSELPQVPMYYALVLMDIIICGLGLSSISANPRRSYVLPAPSWMLALSRMLPTALSAAAFYVVSASVLNLTFGAGWPLLGPALFIAVTSSATLAAAWIGQRAPWGASFGGILVAGLLGFWFHAHHGAYWGETPQHVWNAVTLWDAAQLGLGLLLSFVVGGIALHRNRHEDVPSAWLSAPMSWTGRQSAKTFLSRESAQLWFEWRHRVFAIPLLTIIISVGIPLFFVADMIRRVGWQWSSHDFAELVEAQIMIALISPIWNGLGIGILSGFINSTPKDRSLGTFRGTLPVSDRWQAHQLLRASMSAFLASWVLTMAGAAIVVAIVQAFFGSEALPIALRNLPAGWRIIVPALMAFLSGWATLGAVLSAALTGRVWMSLLPAYACALVGLYGAGVAPHVSQETTQIVAFMFGVALVYGWLACGYSAALAKGLVHWRDVGVAAAVWFVGTMAMVIIVTGDMNANPLMVFGNLLVTAALAPWATAPLALEWNRHR